MRTFRIVVVLVIVVAGGLTAWLLHRGGGSDTPATAKVTQPNGSSVVRAATSAPVEPAQLAITVVDAKGPLAASLRIDGGEVTTARTNGDGVAHVELPPGAYAISASADGHLPSATSRTLAAGEHATLAITLVEGGRTLTGIVTDSYGGAIASARIDAASLTGALKPGHAVAVAMSGADGRYKLTVATGQLLVGVSHPEYAPQSRFLELGDTGATADFALVPGGVIEGVVRDERTKEPVAGARVGAERDQPALQLAEAAAHTVTAGADGRFRIAGLRPGAYELVASAAGRRSRTPTRVGLGVAEQLTDVEILVGTGAVVRGKVIDDKGAPAGGVTVVAMSGIRDQEVTAGPDGGFELSGLSPGKHFLRGQGNAYVPDRMVSIEVAQQDVDGVVVRVKKGEKVTGHVEPRQPCEVRMDLDDDALVSGQMPMMVAPVTTDPEGNFELSPLSPGKTTLAARCPSGDQGALAVDVVPGLAAQVIAVVAGASIAGRVIDGDGKPVANATVIASARGTSEHVELVNGVVTSGVQALTGAAGTFELVGLAAATYALGVQDRGRPLRPRTAPPLLALAATDHKTGIELAVDRPTGKIAGTVTGPDGKPLADAWVSARQSMQDLIAGMVDRGGEAEAGRTIMVNASGDGGGGNSTELPPALTGASGHFELTGLPHVKYQIVAEAQAGKLRGHAADVTPDATIAIQVAALTSLSGTVHGTKGLAGLFTVELTGPTQVTRTFTQGTFEIARVDPGSYVVHVTSADGNGEAPVTVVAGQAATVDVALAANAVVTGKLVDGTGKPGAHLAYTIIDDAGDGHMAISLEGPPPTTGDDGGFRIESKPGKKIFVVMTQPRPFAKRGLVLEAGKTLDLGAVDYTARPTPTPPPHP